MTGDWYTWSGVKDPAAYVGTWRHAINAMRSVPGAHFTFDWNVSIGFANPEPMYPGDAYVDLIGADNYDSSWAWKLPAQRPRAVWNQHPDRELGPQLARHLRQVPRQAAELPRVGRGVALRRSRWRRRHLLHAAVPQLDGVARRRLRGRQQQRRQLVPQVLA